MDGADQVFAGKRVHASFAADGAVDHRQQGRWNLNVGNSALENRRHKSGEIANYAATETDDERFTVESSAEHLFAQLTGMLQIFRIFSGRNGEQFRFVAGRSQVFRESASKKRSNVRIGNDRASAGWQMLFQYTRRVLKQSRADENRIR